MFSAEDKKYILNLARQSIAYYFEKNKILNVDEDKVPQILRSAQACFVTLTINNELRGCIGHTRPVEALYLDIIDSSIAAAFQDPRFSPLTIDEFANVQIEVSILSVPKKLYFVSSSDLLNQLRPTVDGVIIARGSHSATFLPQVWEELIAKELFLSSLCVKAGLPEFDWQKPGLEVETYQVEIIK